MAWERKMFSHKFTCLKVFFLFGIVIFMIAPIYAAADDAVVVKMRGFREDKVLDAAKEYKYQLLDLILNKTKDTDGPYRIEVTEYNVQSRVIEMVKSGDLSLIMTMTSKEREEELLPIRIPVYKGLYGYRVFIINKKDQEKFSGITTVDQLKKLWAGQGHDWPDLAILKHNGFHVVAGASYNGLFDMLAEGRFDYFPRGVHEPWKEINEHKDRKYIVEPRLCVHYPTAGYIFVSKDNEKLADRLTRGFGKALKDGSFDRLFNNHPDIANVLAVARLKDRLIFDIENPLLTKETPLDNKELWYQP